MRNRITTAILAVALLGFAALGVANITKTHNKLKTKDIQLQSKQSDLQLLEIKFNKLNIDLQKEQGNKTQDQKKIEELQKAKDDLQKQLEATQEQVRVKAEQKVAEAKRLQQAASLSTPVYAESSNFYKNYIYDRESGNCPTKWQGEHGACPAYHGTPSNPNVGYGLCQATPGWKMASAGADWATNYATQDAWCTSYANKYGGWANAYNFWVNNHWW